MPGQCTLVHADKAFDGKGNLADARAQKSVRGLVAKLAATAARLRG